MRKEFGGCAGNIAYNLRMLGERAADHGDGGQRFRAYAVLAGQTGRSELYQQFAERLTAQAYITTDLDDNQITAFHPGAMDYSHQNQVPADAGITLGMISPDGRQGMIDHARNSPQPVFRLFSIRARGCRCSTVRAAALHRSGDMGCGQRLRRADAAGTHRLVWPNWRPRSMR